MSAGLPTGDVTFLFTDLEGSTRLLERDPDGTGRALARHHQLLADAVSSGGGFVFETVGDAVYAAFERPQDAIAAALASQRALAAEDWGAIGTLRARMAIHGGAVERVGEHYFGPALFRCARLQALAHGGQTLISHTVVERLGEEMPAGAELRALGSYRLKDLAEPERVYQVSAPDLQGEFPALRTPEGRPNNLPIQATSFIGRRRQIAEVGSLVATSRIVTLMGPGGTGKTRLALEVAADVIERYPDGVFFVALSTVTESAMILPTIASTLAVHDVPGESSLDTLAYAFRDRTMLLLLDNLEQIPDAGPPVAALLQAAAGLSVVATSRVALQLQAERRWSVPAMELPSVTQGLDLAALAQNETIQLFTDRARLARHDFELTPANAADVVTVCTKLDGLPLAIELAAARVTVFEPAALLARLEHRLALLTGGARDRPERQRTLRSTIAWSWDLLGRQEQTVGALLAVFVGGWTLEAAESICIGESEVPDPLGAVSTLIDASLIRRSMTPEGSTRFTMLETIRDFAQEQLEARLDVEVVLERHATWVTAFVERADLRGPDMPLWQERLEAEHDNIRAALDWSCTHGRLDLGRRMVAGLWKFWWLRGHASEGLERAEEVLALSTETSNDEASADLAGTLNTAGVMILEGGGDLARAVELFQRAILIYRRTGPTEELAETTSNLGVALHEAGFVDAGAEQSRQALELARSTGDTHETILCLANSADVWIQQGNYVQSERLAAEAVQLAISEGDPETVIAARTTLADALLRQPNVDEALPSLVRVFDGLPDLHSHWHSMAALVVASRLLERIGQTDQAIRSLAAVETWVRASRSRVQRGMSLDLVEIRKALIECVGSERFEAAYADGAAIELDLAVLEAAAALRQEASKATSSPERR